MYISLDSYYGDLGSFKPGLEFFFISK